MSEKKQKVNYKERIIGKGEFGVGETLEDVKSININDMVHELDEFSTLTKDLTPEQKKHVSNETKKFADKYQEVFSGMIEQLSDPEKAEEFRKELFKRFGRG